MDFLNTLNISFDDTFPQPSEIIAFYKHVKEVSKLRTTTNMLASFNNPALKFRIDEIRGLHGMACNEQGIDLIINNQIIRIWDKEHGFKIPVSYTNL